MIELKHNQLKFSFPQVHPKATLSIDFQRTLRIPDDDHDYPLPPGLGSFPLQHVDDHAGNVPPSWLQHGGVMMPMFQSEAMWLSFGSTYLEDHQHGYPFAIKVATGKCCALSGQTWREGLQREPQNYLTVPEQPWLDGYVVAKGLIRQFVAMPLGSGYSAEEQLTGKAEHGGLQLSVYPMKRETFERRFPKIRRFRGAPRELACDAFCGVSEMSSPAMGLAAGGKMRQEIYDDPFDLNDWQIDANSRCFVHFANSLLWQSITGSAPPHPAPSAQSYTQAGLPWFDHYDDAASAVEATEALAKLKSVAQLSQEKGDVALPENESVRPENVVVYHKGLKKNQVRESVF